MVLGEHKEPYFDTPYAQSTMCLFGSLDVSSKFKLLTYSSCDGCCVEADVGGTCKLGGDQCAAVGKMSILFSVWCQWKVWQVCEQYA